MSVLVFSVLSSVLCDKRFILVPSGEGLEGAGVAKTETGRQDDMSSGVYVMPVFIAYLTVIIV